MCAPIGRIDCALRAHGLLVGPGDAAIKCVYEDAVHIVGLWTCKPHVHHAAIGSSILSSLWICRPYVGIHASGLNTSGR